METGLVVSADVAAHRRKSGRRRSPPAFVTMIVALTAALMVSVIMGISVGSVAIPLSQSWRIVLHHLVPELGAPTRDPVQDQIIWEFRLPRALLAVLVGAGLGLIGTVLQAVVRNPLADPYLLGVSSGAALGAVLILVVGPTVVAGLSLSAAAFFGALVATGLVYVLAKRRGQITSSRLILAGVAISYLFQAGYSYLLVTSDDPQAAQSVLFWLLGSLGTARWSVLTVPAAALIVGGLLVLARARSLNALLAGEDTAISLGVNVGRLRTQLLIVTSLLTGVIVAVSGAIGFVGLIVPHMVRLVVGSNHRLVFPVVALSGAIFLVIVDLVARTAHPPQELPLTIVTAVVGVPFFLWLLRRRDRSDR